MREKVRERVCKSEKAREREKERESLPRENTCFIDASSASANPSLRFLFVESWE